MTDMSKSKKIISIVGVCSNCENRENCDFVQGINSYVRDSECADRISDVEITVYSCDDYEY